MKKQRLFLLLSVTILLLAGCGGKETQVTEEQSVETETQTVLEAMEDVSEEKETETVTEQPEETPEATEQGESDTAEDNKAKDSSSEGQTSAATEKEQNSQNQSNAQNEPSKPQTTDSDTKPEPEAPQEPQQPSQPEPVSYSPERVVQLATEKTKANGKIYIPDDLNRMLAEGTLSQEDYNACYPTDGAGYLEYYVATDLNEARDVSGTVNFNSEDDIAANIAGMYNSLPQQYFYIEYHGTVTYGGKECYVFYCYRA